MKLKTKFFLTFFIVTFLISLVISYIFYLDTTGTKFEELRSEITSVAASCALFVDEQKHSRLQTKEDISRPEYIEIRDRLRQFQKNFPRVRYVYTMSKTEKPDIWKFVVDATEPRDDDGDGKISELEDTTPIGEEYDISKYPEMQKAFENPIANKKLEWDKWGCWLSGFSPIYNSKGVATAIVGLDVSAETIALEKEKLKKRIFIIFGFSIIVSFIFSFFLANSLTKPLLKVIKITKLISQGKYENFIQEKRNNEIGDLISSVNEMAKNIKSTVDKLKTLSRTSEILTLTLDMDEALKLSINLAIEILGCSKGIVLFLDKMDEKLSLGIASGFKTVKVIEDELFVEFDKFSLRVDKNSVDFMKAKPKIYTVGELQKIPELSQQLEWLKKTQTTNIALLMVKQTLRGFVLFDGEIKDEGFAKTLFNQISMTLENARLYHEAVVDGLTELYVKRYFEIQLDLEIRRAQRFNKSFSLLMFDIDFFKKFNDTYGHQAGDFVLKEVSKTIKLLTRTTDIVARYGGEEITAILPETDIKGGQIIAEKIRSKIEEHQFNWQDKILKVTVSIGAAGWSNEKPLNADALVSEADVALYKAKTAGRNKVCT
ncbi:MAG: diguanylate cyclase [Elusimicrobiota bacterium]